MNILKIKIKNLLGFAFVISTSLVFGQGEIPTTEAVTVAPAQSPIYDQLGVSSTTLFIVMTAFTLLLLIFVSSMASSTKNIIKYKQEIRKKNQTPKILLALVGLFISFSANAAETTASSSLIPFPDKIFWAYIVVDIVLLMLIIYFAGIVKGTISEFVVLRRMFRWKKFGKKFTNAVPVEQESSILLDHDYDGITELDNDLPPWWKYGFYVTIVWAVGYFFYYQILEIGPVQEEEYAQEMADGELQMAEYKALHPEMITIDNVELLTDETTISLGRSIFKQNCVSCHMEGGIGGLGPNLTDDFWLYDNDIKGVFNTISEGANNGMKSWKSDLSADKIQAVSSFILQLDYVAPPTGKEPQGEQK